MDFGYIFCLTFLGFIFVVTEINIFVFILMNEKLFQMTNCMKNILNNARTIGKPFFLLIAYITFLLEVIPNIIVIVIIGIVSFLQFLANKDKTYMNIFNEHIRIRKET